MHTQLEDLEPSGSHQSMITHNLELIKRQAQNFVGYTYSDAEWIPITCVPGYTFAETKPFGLNNPGYCGCCATSLLACHFWTTCTAGTLVGIAGSATCGLGSLCESAIVATSQGVELEGDLWIYCGTSNGIFYKTPPSAAPSTTSVLTTPHIIPSQTSQNYVPTAISNSPLSTNSTTGAAGSQTTSPSSTNISGAAIAGAVVGPICGVALLLGLVLLFLRERRRKPPPANVSSNPQPPPPGPITPFGDYTAGKPELDAANAPNSPHLVSIPPAYPGSEAVETAVTMKNTSSPTMSHGTGVGSHTQILVGQQLGPQVQQQIQGQQFPASGHVMAELGTNPRVTGMLPELPASAGYFVNTV